MGIIKQAKNIVIKVQSDSAVFVKENMSKTAEMIVFRTIEDDIKMISAKKLKTKSNGN